MKKTLKLYEFINNDVVTILVSAYNRSEADELLEQRLEELSEIDVDITGSFYVGSVTELNP